MNPNIDSSECFPANYTVYRKDREGARAGGVFIAVRNDLITTHLISFILSTRSLLDPAILDDVAQLWEDRCTSLVRSASLALRNLPYCNMTIVITSDQILGILPLASGDAGDSFTVAPVIWAFKQDRAIDLQVPQSDGTLLVASGHQAAVWQEGHAA